MASLVNAFNCTWLECWGGLRGGSWLLLLCSWLLVLLFDEADGGPEPLDLNKYNTYYDHSTF